LRRLPVLARILKFIPRQAARFTTDIISATIDDGSSTFWAFITIAHIHSLVSPKSKARVSRSKGL